MPATLNYAQAYQQGLQKRYSENGLLFTQNFGILHQTHF